MQEWHIYTDGQGRFALAKEPSGAFILIHSGPFATFADGAAAMKALGAPGW